jgi:hypothetical protein
MEALLQSLAAKYGYEYAVKLLGLDEQTQNPKYAISMGGKNINVGNMVKKNLLNQGIKALTGSSSMGMAVPLIAGGLGLAYLRNPLRKGSMNYMPGLQQELNFAADKGYLDGNKYGGGSILSGQNAVSMFGTNSYLGQLEKYRDKYEDTMSTSRLKQLNDEIAEAKDFTTEKNETKDYGPYTDNKNDGGNGSTGSTGSTGSKSGKDNSKGGMGTASFGQSFHARRGGIASL